MKKCPECEREVDKFGIACQYCGRVTDEHEKEKAADKKEKLPETGTAGNGENRR